MAYIPVNHTLYLRLCISGPIIRISQPTSGRGLAWVRRGLAVSSQTANSEVLYIFVGVSLLHSIPISPLHVCAMQLVDNFLLYCYTQNNLTQIRPRINGAIIIVDHKTSQVIFNAIDL